MSAPSGVITHGDLLLRADGSFTLGLLDLRPGTWYADGSSFRLVFLTEAEWPGGMDGDSLWVTDVESWNQRLLFRRARMPETGVTSGTYVLTSIDGDTIPVSGDGSEGARIVFDTLTFSEGLFFRRHQGERYGSPEDPATYRGFERLTHGSYDGSERALAVRVYWPIPLRLIPDSLAIVGGTLVRRTPRWDHTTGEQRVREEVYSRIS